MKDVKLIDGFGFSGYRSFGDKLAMIAPLKKINLIIGQNNSGKSNIIRFLDEQMDTLIFNIRLGDKWKGMVAKKDSQRNNNYSQEDYPISSGNSKYRIAFPIKFDKYIKQILSNPRISSLPESQKNFCVSYIEKIFDKCFPKEYGYSWFTYYANSPKEQFSLKLPEEDDFKDILNFSEWKLLVGALIGKGITSLKEDTILETIDAMKFYPYPKEKFWPNIKIIPAIRKIALVKEDTNNDFSGLGLIDRLVMIQNPEPFQEQDRRKFEEINKFVQVVLENEGARIEIPHSRETIVVHMDGKALPLESLGTGVHEVIIIAAAATLLDNTIVCIEEPELHLHPLLQKKLINYLYKNTTNQYFITTHSAHLLDAVEAEIFHVTLKDGQSYVESISSTQKKFNICRDLGYKASDILQANCIIWVEGPSDRIYLNWWIKGKQPDLIEGIDYSIMFYGGRLVSHLSGLDHDGLDLDVTVDDLISLRTLNQNSVIVLDSDKSSNRAKINNTKKRLKDEFNTDHGFAWITQGREVENYLNEGNVEKAVLAVHPSAIQLENKGQWINLLKYQSKNAKKGNKKEPQNVTADKVKVAKYYTKHFKQDYTVLDLGKRIDELIAFILKCNDK